MKRAKGTWDNTFLTPDAAFKVIRFVVERYEAQFQTRKLRGFQQVEEEIRAIFKLRYPRAWVEAYTKLGVLPTRGLMAAEVS